MPSSLRETTLGFAFEILTPMTLGTRRALATAFSWDDMIQRRMLDGSPWSSEDTR